MTSTSLAAKQKHSTGRASEELYCSLRNSVLSGQIGAGQFLPTERVMAARHGVAHTTVRRALDKLKADGLIRAEPRKGYRVLSLANDPAQGCPVAIVRSDAEPPERWDEFHMRIVGELQIAADRRGWPLLGLGAEPSEPGRIAARLKAARTSAVIVDTDDPETIGAVKELGLPALMLDSWLEGCGIDSVMQDGHHGGMLAARHLAGLGCRRIAWFGPTDRNAHAMDRFGGFAAGLLAEGVELPPDLICGAAVNDAGKLDAARRLLSGGRRPEAVAALWGGHALALKQAADEAGLVIGRDLHMVGWSPEELYAREYAPAFAPGPVAPAVTWSIRAMAEAAVAVLAERRANPGLPPLRGRVAAELRP
jgi:DNA-binding LacI/PurR family transcriptional regulator